MRSATLDPAITSRGPFPEWCRYVVDVITHADQPWENMRSVMQGFGSRDAAERFARALSAIMPRTRTADDCSSSWVCVGAVESRQHYDRRSVCFYLTLDPGCVVIKRHEIAAGYFGRLDGETVAEAGC